MALDAQLNLVADRGLLIEAQILEILAELIAGSQRPVIPVGEIAYAECTPLHRGRTTTVWQTRITRGDGKLAAIVTQTQLMMTKPGG